MTRTIRSFTHALVLAALFLAAIPGSTQNFPGAQGNPSILSRPGGGFYAPAFNWQGRVVSGNSSTGSQSIIIANTQNGITLPDGTVIPFGIPFSTLTPIVVGYGQSNQETVTPTATSVGACPSGNLGIGQAQCVTITASFSNTHGQSETAGDGTFGLQTAINYAQQMGGGIVTVDSVWSQMGGTNAMLTAAVPFSNVSIADYRANSPQFWNVQTGATTLAAPATLTAATVGFGLNGAATTGGFYTGTSTYVYCIAYVDIMGQEGPCSATFSAATAGTGAVNQIGFSAPAASTGAVGYTIYISLAGGSYALAYKVPLVSQPSTAGPYPASNSVCTLTKLETITPACAVTNATYGQTGSAAIVSALTLNTSPIDPQITTVSSTTVYTPNAGGRTTAAYVPGSHIGVGGLNLSFLPFAISAAEASTVPSVLGTINVQPGFMNYVGRTIEICGKATTTASTATIVSIQFQWDSMGMNTAGKGVQIGNLSITPVAAFSTTKVITFCEQFMTTVAGATATSGSINSVGGYIATSGVASAAAGQGAGSDATIGTVASLNLAADARINVISVHTTGTDGAALTLQSLTVKVLN